MPKRIKNTEHGTLTFVDQSTLTFEDCHGNREEATLEITRFNGPDSCLTFFGEAELLRRIGKRPHPRDYFKEFRAERYKGELRLLASTIPAHTEEWREIKRDIFRGFYAQIAMEASRLFPRTEEFAKRWFENKIESQRCPHELEPLLRSDPDGELSATTILEWLDERHPGRFGSSQLRTLQRRIRDYRALHGPDREVYFQQEHPPGREAQVDFTHCSGLGVTIGGETFRHLLFHLVLSHSGWSYAEVCFGETFAALVKGLQGALWELGGVPRVIRTDNLSAATHELRDSRGRAMNASYEAVLAHYGVEATRTNPRSSHENGVVEQRHRRLKNALG